MHDRFTGAWTSGNTSIATVDSTSGLIRAVAKGTTDIVARYRAPGVPPASGTLDIIRITVQ